MELLSRPTAPFREDAVVAAVSAWLARANVPFFRDPVGNLVVGVASAAEYRRLVRANPLFQRVLPAAARPSREPLGCSFCASRIESLTSPGSDLLGLVEKQFRGILETGGRGEARPAGAGIAGRSALVNVVPPPSICSTSPVSAASSARSAPTI